MAYVVLCINKLCLVIGCDPLVHFDLSTRLQAMNYEDFLVIVTALSYYLHKPSVNDVFPDTQATELLEEYDFIIVGAGTAGCVVASRLSEIAEWTILLIEAGGEETVESQIPLPTWKIWNNSDLDWSYRTTPQKTCLDKGGRCVWPRGKIMGGSGAINSMIYFRGNPRDFDDWAAMGAMGWSYKEVLPYFKVSENNRAKTLTEQGFHGYGGLQTISSLPYKTKFIDLYIEAAKESGIKEEDLNGHNSLGIMRLQSFTADGTRLSTNRAFLRPFRHRRNLHVTKNTFANKIVFNKETAEAVEISKGLHRMRIRARKEIIVSAGPINGPQLLMLSGVGPEKHLKSLGIPVLKDVPVGDNLHDHLNSPLTFTSDGFGTSESEWLNIESILAYEKNNSGLLTLPTGNEVLASIATNYSDPQYPDIDITVATVSANDFGGNYSVWGCESTFIRPLSRGTVRLKSTNPHESPLIDPNYLSDPEGLDLKVQLAGIKKAYQISQASALKRTKSRILEIAFPHCMNKNFEIPSDEYFMCIIIHHSHTSYHPVGTNKMGSPQDPSTVVEPNLKVKGLPNLRVIDSSVMPRITSSNTNAPTLMIAEKGSDIIKADHGRPTMIHP